MKILFAGLCLFFLSFVSSQIIVDQCVAGNTLYLDKVILDFTLKSTIDSINTVRGKLLLEFAALDQQMVNYDSYLNVTQFKDLRSSQRDLLSCLTAFDRRVDVFQQRISNAPGL
eukprot:TRINITY_DN2199_c0_g1_i1.p1 TRINITY_DN2199_c0_g1~~TRINITY_DN2199_c0_g1_i1.p1  ORF type:complete len:114 (-),score=38.50 TRINITY_DN2199_c0_g1_i1:72-413(-)